MTTRKYQRGCLVTLSAGVLLWSVRRSSIGTGYGGGRVARFINQIVTTNMAGGGDSGSLVTDLCNNAVGLLFAGSATVTVLNHYEDVRSLLRVELAERIELRPCR